MTETLIAPRPVGHTGPRDAARPATVFVDAADPVTRTGLCGQLRQLREFTVTDQELQVAAIALYRSSGYEPVPGFGIYRDEPDAHYFGRRLV